MSNIEKWYCVGVSLRQWRRNYVQIYATLCEKGGLEKHPPRRGFADASPHQRLDLMGAKHPERLLPTILIIFYQLLQEESSKNYHYLTVFQFVLEFRACMCLCWDRNVSILFFTARLFRRRGVLGECL